MSIRLGLYIAAALAIAGAAFYVRHLSVKAGERDQAVAALASYSASVEARDKQAAKDRVDAERRSTALALTLENTSAQLEELRKQSPKVSVKYVQVAGETCPRPRIDAGWLRIYTEAANASAVPYPN